MKKYLLFCLLPIVFSCGNDTETPTETKQPTEKPVQTEPATAMEVNFDWLLGDWERTNEQKAVRTTEHWEKISNTEYIGSGITMKLQDTVWMENVRLVKVGDAWNFEAKGMGEAHSTVFKLSDIGKEKFTCRNEENEFPKQIDYFRANEMLKAVISGGGPDVAFDFKPI